MDDLDRILSSDDVVTPSPGFAAGVMDAVQRAAAQPPPVPFPWGRFALGLLACTAPALAGAVLVEQVELATVVINRLAAVAPELGYAAVAVLVSLAPLYVRRLLPESA